MTDTRNTFSTERLQLACYLHASSKLKFSRCEHNGTGKVSFIFSDPEHLGDSLELSYERGEAVSASGLFASQKFLRRKMSESLGERSNGHDHQR